VLLAPSAILSFILFGRTRKNLRQQKSEALDNPEHSPDISSFHFHPFEPLMRSFGSCRFADDAEVIKKVPDWFHTDSKFFSDNVKKRAKKRACGPLDNVSREAGRIYIKVIHL
jgi:hypothetical protein